MVQTSLKICSRHGDDKFVRFNVDLFTGRGQWTGKQTGYLPSKNGRQSTGHLNSLTVS